MDKLIWILGLIALVLFICSPHGDQPVRFGQYTDLMELR